MFRYTVLALMGLLAVLPAMASTEGGEHSGHTAASTPVNPNIYATTMNRVHASIDTESSGDNDVDFVKSMIPHHQSAVDMAEMALEKSQDPFVRKLATDIMIGQKSEIAAMQNWLNEHE